MADQQEHPRKKGTFSKIGLPISRAYVFPISRRLMMLMGAGLGGAVLVYFLADTALLSGGFVSGGPLSSNHADFETDCVNCHGSFKSVADKKCQTCHEKTRDTLGVYSLAAHYLYKSRDTRRIAEGRKKHLDAELACASCHPEHNGRDAVITSVPDSRCVSCHRYDSFNEGHPQFEFARNRIPDDSTLVFTHVRHTSEILKKLNTTYIEQACLYCHNPQPDGRTFGPIDYDVHCWECHLTSADKTRPLQIRDTNDPNSPGVETLDMIQRRSGPGTLWAFYTNPAEFQSAGGNKITKSPVYHEDPWILENLNQLRRILYSDLGLSDLLKAVGGLPTENNLQLYKEAVQRLREYVLGLRQRPEMEVHSNLDRVDSLLDMIERKIADPSYFLQASAFALGAETENPALTASQKNDVERFALRVAELCAKCHIVSKASILRVQAEQQALDRSFFDHRAHILERGCLECHTEIPIPERITPEDLRRPFDRSATQNIPKMENCIECHSADRVSNRCVTCHYMHPNKLNRANLKLFVEQVN